MTEQQQYERAIPAHMQVPRTQAERLPEGFVPPVAAYCARFPKTIDQLVMAIIGAQSRPNETLELKDLETIFNFVQSKDAAASLPSYWDLASVRDNTKAHNLTVIAYWPSTASYKSWLSSSGFGTWWEQLNPKQESHGWFLEVFYPVVDSFETIISDNVLSEGCSRMSEAVSEPVLEHVYWGSMRDRLPKSQIDPLDGDPVTRNSSAANGDSKSEGQRVKVPGRRNLCVIRSTQDWSKTPPEERKLYLNTMHPVLIRGMMFLRDQGEDVDCFECRFMHVHDKQDLAVTTDRTFGLAYFNDMAALEGWSKDHKTHLDIFGRFLEYAKELEGKYALKLFHEVLVVQPEQQFFEYVGCHAGSGMLSAVH